MGPETDDRNITRRAHHAPRSNSLRAPSAVARRLRRPIAATPIQPEGQSPDWLRTRYSYDRLCTFVSHIFRYPLAYSGYVLPNPPFKISLPIYFPNSSLNSFSSCRTIPPPSTTPPVSPRALSIPHHRSSLPTETVPASPAATARLTAVLGLGISPHPCNDVVRRRYAARLSSSPTHAAIYNASTSAHVGWRYCLSSTTV